MDIEMERRIIRLLWYDLASYRLWMRYLEIAFDNTIPKAIALAKMKLLEKEIDFLEKKMLDISMGIGYNNIDKVKKKYNIDFGSMLFGFFNENR